MIIKTSLLLLLGSLTLLSTITHSSEVIIGVSDSSPGALEYLDGKFQGKVGNEYQCVVDNFSMPSKVLVAPNSRLFRLLETSAIDILLPLAQTEERDQIANFAQTILTSPFLLYSKNIINDVENLEGLSIVSVRAAASNERIVKHNGSLIEVENYLQGVIMTHLGRADGVVIPAPALDPLRDNLKGLEKKVYYVQNISLYVQKSREDILEKINKSIDICTNQ
jgi:ABC-type amino acid transport substrate-binding protein